MRPRAESPALRRGRAGSSCGSGKRDLHDGIAERNEAAVAGGWPDNGKAGHLSEGRESQDVLMKVKAGDFEGSAADAAQGESGMKVATESGAGIGRRRRRMMAEGEPVPEAALRKHLRLRKPPGPHDAAVVVAGNNRQLKCGIFREPCIDGGLERFAGGNPGMEDIAQKGKTGGTGAPQQSGQGRESVAVGTVRQRHAGFAKGCGFAQMQVGDEKTARGRIEGGEFRKQLQRGAAKSQEHARRSSREAISRGGG